MISGALEVAKFEVVNFWTVSGIGGKLYRNQMVHLELRLKTMCSEAVSHSSLSLTPWKNNLKNKTSLDIIFLLWYSIQCRKFLKSRYFSPLQQISMDRNAIKRRSALARRELQNPTHQFYAQKNKLTSTCFNPFIVPKKLASFPALLKPKLMQRAKYGFERSWGLRDWRVNERLIWRMGEVAVRGGRFEGCLFFFGLYGLFIFLLFHIFTTTIRCDIVYIYQRIYQPMIVFSGL